MKKFIVTLCLFGSLFVIDRDGVYDVSGKKYNAYDDKKVKGSYQGQVFEDQDHDIQGYVQENRYDRKIRVHGVWDGKGTMILKDDMGNKYDMEVDEEEY